MRVLLVALLLLARLAAADCCHVNKTTGNDSTGDGSLALPYATISKAASVVAPGQNVYIGTNLTYTEQVTMSRSGTAGNPITFTVEGGATPIWDGPGTANSGPLSIVNASYVNVTGLHIKCTAGCTGNFPGAITISGVGNHFTISNNEIDHSSAGGIYVTPTGGAPHFVRITGNTIHDNTNGGIYIGTVQYVLIDSNIAYNNTPTGGNFDGIQGGIGGGQSEAPQHIVVSNNIAHDNGNSGGADNIDLGGHIFGDFFLADGNEVYSSTGGDFKCQQGFGGTTIIVRRNRITNRKIQAYEFPSPAVWYNNDIVEASDGGRYFFDTSGAVSFGTDTCAGGANVGQACPTRSCPGSTCTGPHLGFEFKNNYVGKESANSRLFWFQSSGGLTSNHLDMSWGSFYAAKNLYRFTNSAESQTNGFGWYNLASYPPGQTNDNLHYPTFVSKYQGCGNTCSGTTAGTCVSFACTAPATRVGDVCVVNSDCDERPDLTSSAITTSFAATFTNAAARDYTPVGGSPLIDAGGELTTVRSTGSGTVIPVVRPNYFMDGWCVAGECLRGPDQIVVGTISNAPLTVALGGIDIANRTITVTASTSWTAGDKVYFYPFTNGSAPDVGAFESGTTSTSTTVATTSTSTVPTTSTSSSSSTSSTSSTSTTSTSSSLPGATTSTSSTLPLSAPKGWICTGCKFFK